MRYTANIEGFENQNIEVDVSFWTGPKLLVNGEPAQRGSKRGEMILQRHDGRQVTASWKQQAFGLDVPQLVVDGKITTLAEPLKWYQFVWSGLPVILVFMGGALGAIAGLIGFSISTRIFRAEMNPVVKYLASAVVSVLAVVAYFIAAVIFSMLIGG